MNNRQHNFSDTDTLVSTLVQITGKKLYQLCLEQDRLKLPLSLEEFSDLVRLNEV